MSRKKSDNRASGKACVYCAAMKHLTREHVPPKSLFAPPRPSDLITVPCCAVCNSSGSRDDEYLRLALCIRAETCDHPDAKAGFQALLRSLQNPKQDIF